MATAPQGHPESILIVRLGAMGDVLHAMPAVAALRMALPETRIGWAIERRWAELLSDPASGAMAAAGDHKLVDSIHVVDTLAWRKELFSATTYYGMRRAIDRLRTEEYAVGLDVQGAIKSAVLAKVSGVQRICGFAAPREQLAAMFYRQRIQAQASHVVDQNLELASAVARQSLRPGTFDLPRSPRADAWCEKTLRELAISRFVILNPGSGWGAKSWPAERFAEVAKRLRELGLQCIVNFGPNERQLADMVAEHSSGAARPISCSVTELVALTRRASLFVGGDTGPLHLAAGLNIPCVALFGPTDPARNGPYGTPSVVLRNQKSVTSYSHVADADPGLQSITVDEVIRAASQLLGVPIG
jgi:heptosyltransferase I